MEDEEVIIRGKSFTRQEVEEKGRRKIKVISNVLRWIGVGLFAMGIFSGTMMLLALLGSENETASIVALIVMVILTFVVPGLILFLLSFKKRDAFKIGKAEIERRFPAPLGFDGKVIDVLEGDKTIVLSKRPLAKLIIDSAKMEFQIFAEKYYSKIYISKDLIDYEIRVDNEVIVTSNTKTKKGVGKAVAGGLLFGEAGAIAGAVAGNSKSTTTETQKDIHHYTLVVKVNDLSKPSFVINLDSVQIAEDVVATFDILVGNTKKFSNNETANESESEKKDERKLDKFEEMKKYKELLDSGIITQEEFDAKKKEILG